MGSSATISATIWSVVFGGVTGCSTGWISVRASPPLGTSADYTPVDPSPYLTLWLALNDATIENGCVWMLPGSYKRGLVEHTHTPEGWSCHPLDDPDQGVPVPVKAGSIVVFWSLTMHKSSANISSGPRKAYIIQYSKAGLVSLPTRQAVEHLIPVARDGVTA
ncbi:MAG: phytanoyl-CoA dioxygenase family protein [Armatimonas sp.]